MIDDTQGPRAEQTEAASPRARWRAMGSQSRLLVGAAGVGLIALGVAGGAAGAGLLRPEPVVYQADLAATPIPDLAPGERVAVTGTVAEIFGNKFVVADGAARALVETGPAGEDGDLVVAGEPVTIQGRFDHGFLHATAIRHADGEIETLAPPPPPGPKPPRP